MQTTPNFMKHYQSFEKQSLPYVLDKVNRVGINYLNFPGLIEQYRLWDMSFYLQQK